jgi:hypothetical protein
VPARPRVNAKALDHTGDKMAFPVNEEFIIAEEQRLGASLPFSFREYLKRNRG